MAKIIQLAKDLLKGGNKEDIYPKTIDSAVFITDSNNNPTNNTLKGFWTDLDETLGQYMTMNDFNPVCIRVNSSKTALSAADPTFGTLTDYITSGVMRRIYVIFTDTDNLINYVLPVTEWKYSEYIRFKLQYSQSLDEYVQVTIHSDGSITYSYTAPAEPAEPAE